MGKQGGLQVEGERGKWEEDGVRGILDFVHEYWTTCLDASIETALPNLFGSEYNNIIIKTRRTMDPALDTYLEGYLTPELESDPALQIAIPQLFLLAERARMQPPAMDINTNLGDKVPDAVPATTEVDPADETCSDDGRTLTAAEVTELKRQDEIKFCGGSPGARRAIEDIAFENELDRRLEVENMLPMPEWTGKRRRLKYGRKVRLQLKFLWMHYPLCYIWLLLVLGSWIRPWTLVAWELEACCNIRPRMVC